MKARGGIILAFCAASLIGCSSLRPVVENTRFFVLEPIPATAPAPAPAPAIVIGLARVGLPDYLQRRQIAFRLRSNQVGYSDRCLWAERLDKNIQRVLIANLASQLGPGARIVSEWRSKEAQSEVAVTFQRFEINEAGEAVVEADWRITAPGRPEGESEHLLMTKPAASVAADPNAAVRSLSEALGEVSSRIAGAIKASVRSPSK